MPRLRLPLPIQNALGTVNGHIRRREALYRFTPSNPEGFRRGRHSLSAYQSYPGDAGGVKTPYKIAAWGLVAAFVLGLVAAAMLMFGTSNDSGYLYGIGLIGLAVQAVIVVAAAAVVTGLVLR